MFEVAYPNGRIGGNPLGMEVSIHTRTSGAAQILLGAPAFEAIGSPKNVLILLDPEAEQLAIEPAVSERGSRKLVGECGRSVTCTDVMQKAGWTEDLSSTRIPAQKGRNERTGRPRLIISYEAMLRERDRFQIV